MNKKDCKSHPWDEAFKDFCPFCEEIEQAVNIEREACAKLAEMFRCDDCVREWNDCNNGAHDQEIAAAIRARK